MVEDSGLVSLLVDLTTGIAYVRTGDSAALAVTRSDSYWSGPVQLSRGDATILAAERDSAGQLKALDYGSYGQFGWILDESGHFIGEEKYNATTLPGAETLFALDLNGDGYIGMVPVQPGGVDPSAWTLTW